MISYEIYVVESGEDRDESKIKQRRFGVDKEIVRPGVLLVRIVGKVRVYRSLILKSMIPADRGKYFECLNKGNKEIRKLRWILLLWWLQMK